MGVKGNDADMGVSMGWCSDYPDPYDWINILLYGKTITDDEVNVNYSGTSIVRSGTRRWETRPGSWARTV